MKVVAELIPQVFFDILARYVPGLVLFGAWILLIGQDDWQRLLCTIVGGKLDSGNALPTATLVLLFVPFVVGYAIAPFAKAVQRFNEHGWLLLTPRPSHSVYEDPKPKWRPKDYWVVSDNAAGKGYDWLRANAPESGALAAKIRGEFTMHNALAVAFLAISGMACFTGEYFWAVLSGLAVLLMAYRGATTQKTYQSTTRKLCEGKGKTDLAPEPRLVWLIPNKNRNGYDLWEDSEGMLAPPADEANTRTKAAEAEMKAAEAENKAAEAENKAGDTAVKAEEAAVKAEEAAVKAEEAATKAEEAATKAESAATKAAAAKAKSEAEAARAAAAKAKSEAEAARSAAAKAKAEEEEAAKLEGKAKSKHPDTWKTLGRSGRRLARELEHEAGAKFVFRPHRPSRWWLWLGVLLALIVMAAVVVWNWTR